MHVCEYACTPVLHTYTHTHTYILTHRRTHSKSIPQVSLFKKHNIHNIT